MVDRHVTLCLALLLVNGCGGSVTLLGAPSDAGADRGDAGGDATVWQAPVYGPDAFFADDPPPRYCGPEGTEEPVAAPGGTPECPADKNLPGCPCPQQGATAPCWPGPRANRNLGQCRDGLATCELHDELSLRWSDCAGPVLPTPGVTRGAAGCACFSAGTWQLDNTVPCFVDFAGGATYGVSTWIDAAGEVRCPTAVSATPPPAPQPGTVWSQSTLEVDCAGRFELCFTIKAGDPAQPSENDCTVARSCVTAWYERAGERQQLPALPGWSARDPDCVQRFVSDGGYGEMSVLGRSTACEPIDDSGAPLVFHRVGYCPSVCAQDPTLPGCSGCGIGTSGMF